MLYCIVGETSCGKDTVAKYLSSKYNLHQVCSYTTRCKRINEVNGVEHYFVSNLEAEIILHNKKKDVVAYTEINNEKYFALKEDVKNADIYVIDPEGIKYLRKTCEDLDLCIIYITCSDEVNRQRALNRGDNVGVLDARIKSEKEQFVKFDKDKGYNYKYVNDDSLDKLYEFADFVMRETHMINK